MQQAFCCGDALFIDGGGPKEEEEEVEEEEEEREDDFFVGSQPVAVWSHRGPHER
jgi:hypothetical protein